MRAKHIVGKNQIENRKRFCLAISLRRRGVIFAGGVAVDFLLFVFFVPELISSVSIGAESSCNDRRLRTGLGIGLLR